MFVALVLIVLAVVVAELWRRVNLLQARVDLLESPVQQMPEPEAPPMRPEVSLSSARVVRRAPPEELPAPEPAFAEPPPQPVPPEAGVPDEPEPAAPSWSINFEELFGRRLPIWAGGVTLAVAGVLIVKYSIDAGLLSPLVRVICGLLFGLGLIAGAEWALREEDRVRDPRVRQALSGAGIATFYSSILIAANLYGLVGPAIAFAGMAVVTAAAMGLSLRFGAPSALLGLVGGLAAPALVGSGEPHIPLLASYLALAVGGLCALSRMQRWMWLGASALLGGFGWGAILLLGGVLDMASAFSIGVYVLLLGIAFPLLAFPGKAPALLQAAGSVVAAAQMAVLVAEGGFAMLHWGLFVLLAAATAWLSFRGEAYRLLPAVSLVIGLLLLGVWPDPAWDSFALVALALGVIHAGPAAWRLWRANGTLAEAAMIAVIALGGLGVSMIHFYRLSGSNDGIFAALSLALAMLPAGAAAPGWRKEERTADGRFALLATSAGVLICCAGGFALPAWIVPPFVAGVGFGLLGLSAAAQDLRLERCAWGFAIAGLLFIASDDASLRELARQFGQDRAVTVHEAFIRWGGLGLISGLFAWRARLPNGRVLAQAAAALLGYAALAQAVPMRFLPLVPAIGFAGLALWQRRLVDQSLLPAMAALLAVVIGWALLPLGLWTASGMQSMAGIPMLVTGLPALTETLTRLLIPAALIAVSLWQTRGRLGPPAARIPVAIAAVMGGVAIHILFKQIFGLSGYGLFVRWGLAERTLWEALLLMGSLAAFHESLRTAWLRKVGLALGAAGVAHFFWYTMLLHNPLFAEQWVGGVPIANWLLPAYGIPLLWLVLFGRYELGIAVRFPRLIPAAQAAVILLFAYSSLRQVLHGPMLAAGGLSQAEDILRSVLAIVLAIGFLLWGIARQQRFWRIASLVLMIGAASKVFLFDASGLDGLLRIGSFVALGFSLIGIGWLYSRHIREDSRMSPDAR